MQTKAPNFNCQWPPSSKHSLKVNNSFDGTWLSTLALALVCWDLSGGVWESLRHWDMLPMFSKDVKTSLLDKLPLYIYTYGWVSGSPCFWDVHTSHLKQLRFSKMAAPELIPIQMNRELPTLTGHNKGQPRQHIGNHGNTIHNGTWLLDSTKSLCSGLSRQRSSRWLMPGCNSDQNCEEIRGWSAFTVVYRCHPLSSAFRDAALAKVSKPPSGSGRRTAFFS